MIVTEHLLCARFLNMCYTISWDETESSIMLFTYVKLSQNLTPVGFFNIYISKFVFRKTTQEERFRNVVPVTKYSEKVIINVLSLLLFDHCRKKLKWNLSGKKRHYLKWINISYYPEWCSWKYAQFTLWSWLGRSLLLNCELWSDAGPGELPTLCTLYMMREIKEEFSVGQEGLRYNALSPESPNISLWINMFFEN